MSRPPQVRPKDLVKALLKLGFIKDHQIKIKTEDLKKLL